MIPIEKLIEFTGFTKDELSKPNRKDCYVVARACVYKHIVDSGCSFKYAGEVFDQDHATVMNGIKKLGYIMETNTPLLRKQADLFYLNMKAYIYETNIKINDSGFYPFINLEALEQC